MCSTVPLEDLYKRRFDFEVKIFNALVNVQGVERQEAGSFGQVEEGHGEGGGCQQVADHQPLHWVGLASYIERLKKRDQLDIWCQCVPLSFMGCLTFKHELKQHIKNLKNDLSNKGGM